MSRPAPTATSCARRHGSPQRTGSRSEIVEFTDWNLPNSALDAREIDLNNFQHRPYLANQVKARGYKLVALDPSIVVPGGIFFQVQRASPICRRAQSSAFPTIRPMPLGPCSCSSRRA